MALKYLMRCECGTSLQLDASQAASTIPCDCGKTLEVPALRDLRKLPQVEVADNESNWGALQGATFSAGLILIAIGIWCVVHGYPKLRAAQPMAEIDEHKLYEEEIADFTASELYDAWKEVKEFGLQGRGQNPFVWSRQFSARMLTITITGVGMIIAGGLAIFASVFVRKK